MKKFYILMCLVVLAACKSEEKEETTTKNPSDSVEIKDDYEKIENGYFRSYYGTNNQVKVEGLLDRDSNRHGIWKSYFSDGRQQSLTEYKHGLKDGFTVVYHINGALYYRGEYRKDVEVGVWDYYDVNTGKKSTTKDYGYPK